MYNVYQMTEIKDKEEIWIILWFLKVQCSDITKYSPISNNAVAWHGAVVSDWKGAFYDLCSIDFKEDQPVLCAVLSLL